MTPEVKSRLVEVKQLSALIFERCRQQRIAMLCEREAMKISSALRQYADRARMRKAFQREMDAVARRLVATVDDG